jgi:hypothetical protein
MGEVEESVVELGVDMEVDRGVVPVNWDAD